ncbi:MAG: DUF1176 domain-containing protein [Roseibium sp.]
MLKRLTFFACLPFIIVGGASAELAKTGYGDWSVSCNAENYCIAETPGTGSNDEAFRLKIERGAKPDSKVYVTLRPTTPLTVGMRTRIEVEGLLDNYGFFGLADKVYKGNEITFSGPANRDLLKNLRLGTYAIIQVQYGGPAETVTYWISLTGITHALLKIDEEQNRIGRLDALVARGGQPADDAIDISASASPKSSNTAPAQSAASAPANDVPPPVMPSQDSNASSGNRGPIGQVYAVSDIPETVQMMGYRTLDCQLDETVQAFGAQYFAEGDVEMWVVPCRMADANVPYYMATHIPFNPSLDEWHEFETPPNFNQPNHALINNLFYDPASGQVTGTTYYSPNYDCGTFEHHEMEAESGKFMLVGYYEKSDCDGITGPPEGWPLSWTIDEMGG